MAHKLDLEYEYSLASRVVRISRPVPKGSIDPVPEYDSFINYSPIESIGGAFDGTSDIAPRAPDKALGDFSFETAETEVDAPMNDLANEAIDASNKSLTNNLGFEFESLSSVGKWSYQGQRRISNTHIEARDPALVCGEEEDPRTEGYPFFPDLTISSNSEDAILSSDRFVPSSDPIYDTNGILEI